MRALLHFSTNTWSSHNTKLQNKYFIELDCIPRVAEWVQISQIISDQDLDFLKEKSECWSGDTAYVQMINLKKDENGFYYWIWIECED